MAEHTSGMLFGNIVRTPSTAPMHDILLRSGLRGNGSLREGGRGNISRIGNCTHETSLLLRLTLETMAKVEAHLPK